MTIRSKLILLYSGLLAIIIVVFGISVFAVTRWTLVDSANSTLAATDAQLLGSTQFVLMSAYGEPAAIQVILPDSDYFRSFGAVMQVWQLDNNSGTPNLLNESAYIKGKYGDSLDWDSLMQQQQAFERGDTIPSSYTTVSIGGGDVRVLTLPLPMYGSQVVIQTAISFEAVNQAEQNLVVIIVISTCVALIASIGLGMVLTSSVLKPIDDITRSAAQITAASDLKNRLEWNGPQDELGRLVTVFNKAMQRLEQLFTVQQRFVADVSHELRTPLTAIRGNIDLMKRYGMDQDSLAAIDSEAQRMARLVNDLLLLARADNGELKLNFQELDLDLLIEEAYREAKILAKDRDLKINVSGFEPVRIKGDPDRLKQVLFNLINNAIKFTPDGGQITLSLRKTEADAVIQVQDSGIGISPEDLQRIFDRFYQADASRTRMTSAEGAGLGLSIAQWIVQAHGGKIQVESEVGEGTTFTVTLPHIEEPEKIMSQAVTRPRLPLIRRNLPPEKEEIKP
ncbi:MAG TPA: HAMP domain-containing sensor histidine kinase [Phototrophicaceae bacterium]|nr:HAMP domain-containing sensor histidine kinase [Phototrophicaceae bacterium]